MPFALKSTAGLLVTPLVGRLSCSVSASVAAPGGVVIGEQADAHLQKAGHRVRLEVEVERDRRAGGEAGVLRKCRLLPVIGLVDW